MNSTVTGRGRASEPGGRRKGPHPVQVGHRRIQPRPVCHVPAAGAQPLAGVCPPFRAAEVGALPPPDGHVGGQHPLLGGTGGVGVGGVFGRGHPNVQLWDEPPHPGQPPQCLPSKARPRRETQTPCRGPPQTPAKREDPPTEAQVLRIGQQLASDQALPRPHGKGKGKQAQQKRREEPPSLEGDESPDPLLGEQMHVPYTDGVYPGVVSSVVAGAGGRVWVEHPGEKEMFRVERHLLYASHAVAVTHTENQKAAAAGKKAAKAKNKSNPKPDADPPAEPAPKITKPEPKPEAKQAPQPEPKAAPQAAPMEQDAPAHPSAKPAAQPPAQPHAQAPDGGETQATAPLWADPTGRSFEV